MIQQWIEHQRSKKCFNAIDSATAAQHLLETVKVFIFLPLPKYHVACVFHGYLEFNFTGGREIFVVFGRNHNKVLSGPITLPPFLEPRSKILKISILDRGSKKYYLFLVITTESIDSFDKWLWGAAIFPSIQTFGQTCQVFSMTCPMGQLK